jgi:hypothetical protein
MSRGCFSKVVVALLVFVSTLSLGQASAQQAKQAQRQQKEAERKLREAQKAQQKQAENVQNQEMNLREGALLKEAYIYLAMANHNYNGHRANAMGHVQEAAKILDEKILKKGTNNQKVLALQQDVKAYESKFLAKLSPKEREPQLLSDLQMQEGLKMLNQVKPILVQRKQARVLDKVDSAIADINEGLAYRARGGR